MSGLLNAILGGDGHSKQQEITGSVVQSSIYGLPIPVVYGTARIGGNLVHLPSDPIASTTNAPGGKLARTKGAKGENVFTAPVLIGLCEGPLDAGLGANGILRVWADKDLVTTFAGSYAGTGWALAVGSSAQAAWSYLTTNVPAQALGYQYLAYVRNAAIDLPGYHLRNYSWEVVGLLVFFAGTGDALGSDILTDILTDVNHGLGWVPYGSAGTLIGDLTLYEDYCAAAGMMVSPAYTSQQPAVTHLAQLLEATNSAAVWSDGRLKVIPFGDTTLTGNGHTYTPNVTPIYNLDDDDYISAPGEDPVKVTRKPDVEAFNQIFVEFEDRFNEYNPSTAEAKDDAAIQSLALATGDLGVRPAPKVSLPLIKDAGTARQLAQLRLQREQNVRNTYAFTLGIRYALLEPMDLVTLTDTNLGLSLTPVRIVEVSESPDERGIDIIAEDWPFGTATAALYGSASGDGYGTQATIPPGNTTTPIIFDGPQPLSTAAFEIWMAVSGGPQWGGCEVWLSTDNDAYYRVGLITRKATFGTLTAPLLPADPLPDVDETNTLAVDLTLSQGALVSVSDEDFNALLSLCYVDGEFLAYRDAALTAAYKYDLTYLGRGAYGWANPLPIAAHDIDSYFVLCDTTVFHLPFPEGTDGQTLWFKLPAFNQYGGALQSLADVSPTVFVIGTIPGPPFTLALPNFREKTRDASTVTYQWDRDQRQDAVDVYENVATGTLTGSPWPEKVGGVWPLPTRVLSNTASEITFDIPAGDGVLYAQVIPVDAFGKPGRYARATVTAVGTRPLIYGLTQTIGASGLFTDVAFFVGDPQNLGGTLTAWVNHDSAENADSTGASDGTYTATSAPLNPTPSTTWNKTGGGTGQLLDNIRVHPGRGKLVTFEYVNSLGVSSGKINYTLTSEGGIIDSSGDLLPGSIKNALEFAAAVQPVQVFANVAAFPASANGTFAFALDTGQLYRRASGAWTSAVPAVDITGQLVTAQLAVDSVTSAIIAANAVGTAELAVGAVTTAILAANAVTTATLALGAVTTAIIAASAVTATEIASDAVTTPKILAGAITAAKIAAGTITAAQIAAGTITAVEIAAGAITTTQLAALAVTSAKIAAGTIVAANIAAGAITTTELGALAVTAAKIAANTITAAQIAAGTITATEIAAATITSAKIAANTIVAGNIAAGAITASAIATGAVTAVKISVAVLSGISTDAGTILAGKLQSIAGTTYLDLNATGANPVLHHPAFDLNNDGSAVFSGTVSSGAFTGTVATFAGSLSTVYAITAGNGFYAPSSYGLYWPTLSMEVTAGAGGVYYSANGQTHHFQSDPVSLLGTLTLAGGAVSYGAADSGGTGYRLMLVPN